jgi:hypothetical protein
MEKNENINMTNGQYCIYEKIWAILDNFELLRYLKLLTASSGNVDKVVFS